MIVAVTVGNICYALAMSGFICFKQPILQTLPPTPSNIECATPNIAKELGVKECDWVLK